jgi:polysaccharide chain length determinant protein (PEP-CTERM system associated)
MKFGIKSLQDFFAFLVRRKWWVIAPFVALACIVTILTKELPRIYVSESLVLVRPRDVPENFVMDLITGTTEQRLRSIQQTVMSRSNLVAILQEFRDRLPEFQRLNTDEAVAKLRKQIFIEFDLEEDARGQRNITSFKISYQHKSPEVAQKINEKLTSLFIEQDSRTRETNVYGTTDFLSSELDKKAAELQSSDQRLKVLKASHQSELPEVLEANQRALDRLSDARKSNAEAIDRATTQRLNLQELLTETPEFLEPKAQAPAPPAPPKNPLVADYLTVKKNYERLSAIHPPTYPDVLQTKAQLDRLKASLTPEELEEASKVEEREEEEEQEAASEEDKPEPNRVYLAITAQLRELETEMKLRQDDKQRIDAEIAKYNRRVENTPQVELQLAEVIRENSDLRKQYEQLSSDLSKARLSQSLESKQRGEQFRIIDPANYPVEPSKPNKVVVLLVGWGLSLALAVGIALLVDITRQRVWTQSEIESLWGVPVMVDIPQILTDADVAAVRRKKMVFAAFSVAAMAVYSVCLYGIYLKQNTILQHLDPVLQQLVYR